MPSRATARGIRWTLIFFPVACSAMAMASLRLIASGPPKVTMSGGSPSTATAATSAATSSVATHRRLVSPLPNTATLPAWMSNRPMGAR